MSFLFEGDYPGRAAPAAAHPAAGHPAAGYEDAADQDPRFPGYAYGQDGDGFPAPPQTQEPEGYPEPGGYRRPSAPRRPRGGRGGEPRPPARGGPGPAGRGEPARRAPLTPPRVAAIVVAVTGLVGIALVVPRLVRVMQTDTIPGVVIPVGTVSGLNFAAPGRVATVAVQPGQAVRKGEVLAREVTTAATAGQAAREIVAPRAGTVVAVFGQRGATVTPAGVTSAAGAAAASSRLPAQTLAGLRGRGGELPAIALRASGGWQVRLVISEENPATAFPPQGGQAARVGLPVMISVPGARVIRVSGAIIQLTARPAGEGGGYVAVVQPRAATPLIPSAGMSAEVQLGS